MSKYNQCPCDLKVLYHKCCGQYHEGKLPDNALTLMRSRYSAFALGISNYLIDTTHKDNPERLEDEDSWKRDLDKIASHARFDGLKIIDFVDGTQTAQVTFRAVVTKGDMDLSFTEESHFQKDEDKWLYREGKILESF